MSDFAQYPYELLVGVGTNLQTISDQIGKDSKNAFEIIGFTPDQDRINHALGDYREEWEQSIKKLGDNIGGFGQLSTQIGTMTQQFDAELGKTLRPGGGSAPADPGVVA